MGYTKGDLVEAALTEIGIAGSEFDVVPEQMEKDIRRLDSMLAEWVNQGVLLGYPTNSSPDTSEEDTESNIPDTAIEAVVTNLALRL
ncbi:MAG TPA: packaged DNA stabilization gp4 family protein, partial [Patescibacteria group bacterium]|nr:packaged DNA stabilization gp4 family protein [Patescibacteria group bacterium]